MKNICWFSEYDDVILCIFFFWMQGDLLEGVGAVGVAGVVPVPVKFVVWCLIFCSTLRDIKAGCIRAHVLCLLLVSSEGLDLNS